MTVWSGVQTALSRHNRTVLVSVVATQGSSPREPGARMIVGPDRTFTGTIGGGTLEWEAIEASVRYLSETDADGAVLRSFALGPELGQCCGGRVDILFEMFGPESRARIDRFAAMEADGVFTTRGTLTDAGVLREASDDTLGVDADLTFEGGVLRETFGDDRRTLLLFGAGHVGRAMVMALAPLPFATRWYDTRADAFPGHYPANVTASLFDDPLIVAAEAPAQSFALVMTHSHQLDLNIVRVLLADDRFSFVGLIGSATKRARFVSRLRDGGLTEAHIARLVCPIGTPTVRSKAPAAIAAGCVVQLLERDQEVRTAGGSPAEIGRRA